MNAQRKSELKIDLMAGGSLVATISDDRLWMALAQEALRIRDIPDLQKILEERSPEPTKLNGTQNHAIRQHIWDHKVLSARKLKLVFPYVSLHSLAAFIGAYKRRTASESLLHR